MVHFTGDQINAGFELIGAAMIFNNCRMVLRDKLVRGVSILANTYFTGWGIWNVFYYPSLNQVWSFRAGLCICTANILWILLMLYYKHKEKIRSPYVEAVGAPESAIHN
jgi:hypothetical protein